MCCIGHAPGGYGQLHCDAPAALSAQPCPPCPQRFAQHRGAWLNKCPGVLGWPMVMSCQPIWFTQLCTTSRQLALAATDQRHPAQGFVWFSLVSETCPPAPRKYPRRCPPAPKMSDFTVFWKFAFELLDAMLESTSGGACPLRPMLSKNTVVRIQRAAVSQC
jgi:hypothetical protein